MRTGVLRAPAEEQRGALEEALERAVRVVDVDERRIEAVDGRRASGRSKWSGGHASRRRRVGAGAGLAVDAARSRTARRRSPAPRSCEQANDVRREGRTRDALARPRMYTASCACSSGVLASSRSFSAFSGAARRAARSGQTRPTRATTRSTRRTSPRSTTSCAYDCPDARHVPRVDDALRLPEHRRLADHPPRGLRAARGTAGTRRRIQGQCTATAPSGEAAKYAGPDPDDAGTTILPDGRRIVARRQRLGLRRGRSRGRADDVPRPDRRARTSSSRSTTVRSTTRCASSIRPRSAPAARPSPAT